MDAVVVILSIFSLISAGVIAFLVNDRRTQDKTFKLGDQLEKKITSSIESIYEKREKDFKKTSKENIENVIDPFKKRIKEFEEEVRKNTTQQHEFHTKTKVTIDNLIEQTNQITSDANKLTRALSGESKTQGDYGELKLQMLLENSGLEENIHYKLQKSFTVKTEGDVSREIPDAVIYLPQNRNIIIDSKFSFSENSKNFISFYVNDDYSFKIKTRILINCAGLNSQILAKKIDGTEKRMIPKIRFVKGNYMSLQGISPFTKLVYPTPQKDGLGIHSTINLQGKTIFGPDTVNVDDTNFKVTEDIENKFKKSISKY